MKTGKSSHFLSISIESGVYIWINISETRLGPLPEFYIFGIKTCQWMTYQKKIKKLIITNDLRNRGAYPLNKSSMHTVVYTDEHFDSLTWTTQVWSLGH